MSDNLESIGAYAFSGCTNLSTYYFYTDTPKLTAYETFNNSYNLTIYVPTDYYSNYRTDVYFKRYNSYLIQN